MSRSRGRQYGFTLIELLVVLLLLGVLAGLAVPKLFQGGQEQLRQEAIHLSRVVQWVMDRGIYSGQAHRLLLDYAEQRYWIEEQSEEEGWSVVNEPLVQLRDLKQSGVQFQPDMSRAAWQDSSIQSIEFTLFGPTSVIAVQLFLDNQQPNEGLLVELRRENNKVTVQPWREAETF